MNIFKESRFILKEDPPDKSDKAPEGEKPAEKENWVQKVVRQMKEIRDKYQTKDGEQVEEPVDEPTTPDGVKAGTGAKLAEQAAKIEVGKGGKTTPEAVGDAVKEDTERDLDKLQEEFGPVYGIQKLERVGSLAKFKTEVPYDFSHDPEMYKDELRGEILEFYGKKGAVWTSLKALEEKSEVVPKEGAAMMEIMAAAAATSMIAKIKTEKEVRQKFYDSWSKRSEGVPIAVEGTVGTNYKIVFPKEFEDARLAAQTKAEADAEAKKLAEAPEQKKVDQLIASPIGKILAWMGYKDPKTGKPDRAKYEAIINGTDWFGAFIVGLFGYTEFGGEFYESTKAMLPENVQKSLAPIEARVKASKYHADAWRKTDNYKTVMGADFAAGVDAAREAVDDTKFGDYLVDKSVPEKGIKLTKQYDLKDTKYKITIEKGAKIIVPDGGKLQLDGKPFAPEKGKTLDVKIEKDKKEFTISGIIPKDTIFAGVKFEKIEAEK